MNNRKELFIIDAMSQIYRAFYAIRGLTTSDGFPTNAIYGFTIMLNKIIKKWAPPYLVVTTDVAAPTLRHDSYALYKANRVEMPDELKQQIPFIYEICEAYGIPILLKEGYEADDLIAAIVLRAKEASFTVYILSSDKDLYQLLGDDVYMLDTKSDVIYTPVKVKEKLGIKPDQVIDYLALTGDSSDNIPGAPGIGPKTAATLLNTFGTLDNCIKNVESISHQRIRNILTKYKDQIYQSRDLVTLHPEVPIDWEWKDFKRKDLNQEKLKELFTRFEFKTLLNELPSDEKIRKAEFRIEQGISSLLNYPSLDEIAVFATKQGEVFVGQLTAETIYEIKNDTENKLLELLKKSNKLYLHRTKQFFYLYKNKENFTHKIEDIKIAHYLIWPHINDHSIQRIALDVKGKNIGDVSIFSPSTIGQTLTVLIESGKELSKKITSLGLEKIYREIELPLVPVLAEMEHNGIYLDVDFLNTLSKELSDKIEEIETKIYDLAGEKFNINSPKQLRKILFEKLKLKGEKKTKKTKSYSTGVEVLEQLSLEHELPAQILNYRQLAKLKSTYVDALPPLVNPDTGRIHTTFHQTVAATGRLSSSDPNLQNIPIRTPEGQRIRIAFIAPEGSMLISADYSQIELRIMAHLSRDKNLIEAFKHGADIHTKTAIDIFGKKAEVNIKEYRRQAKAINYSILYGKTDFGLARDLKISRSEARGIIEAYFSTYPGVKHWIDKNLAFARENGYVNTLFGRIRPMPELRNSNMLVQKAGERIATNAPIQGTAADIIKIAMIRLSRTLQEKNSPAKILLQVHDELVMECPKDNIEETKKILKQTMEDVVELSVPIPVDIGVGKNWLDTK